MVRTPRYAHVVILALILVVTAAVYAPLRNAPFAYEDENWMASVVNPVTLTPRPSRALTYATFHWTYERVNLDPTVWHVTNVGIHLVNGVLVYGVVAAVAGAPVALGASGLFLLHPLNSEAVSYVSARTDLLAAMFTLLAVWLVLCRGHWVAISIGCVASLAGAALSKEVGVVGVPLVLLTVFCWRRPSVPWLSPLMAGLWIVLGASVGSIWDQLQSYVAMSPRGGGSVLAVQTYALLQAGMVWKFLLLALWPSGLSIDHDVLTLGPTWLALSALGVAMAVILAAMTWRRSPATTWVVGWVALALAPRFLMRTNEFLNEPQIYLAFVGVWAAISMCASAAWKAARSAEPFWSTYSQRYSTLFPRTHKGGHMRKRRLVGLVMLVVLVGLSPPAMAQVIDTQQVAALSTGSGCATASSCASFQVGTANAVGLQVTGTFTGTLTFEGTANGTTWITLTVTDVSDGSTTTTATAAGVWTMPNIGLTQIRLRATAWTTGVATVTATRGLMNARLLAPIFTRVKVGDGTAAAPSLTFASDPTEGIYRVSSADIGIALGGQRYYSFRTGGLNIATNGGAILVDDSSSAGTLAQRSSTTAQRFSVYNTYTSSVNSESFGIDWQTLANVALVGNRTATTGTSRRLFVVSQGSNASSTFYGVSIAGESAIPRIRIGAYNSDGVTLAGTSATTELVRLGEFSQSATSGSITAVSVRPEYNQASGTAANTDFLINRTETAIGSGTQLLLDAQVGSTSKFSVDRTGVVSSAGASGVTGTCDTPTFTGGIATTCGGSGGSVDGTYFVTSNFTTAANTNFQLITGLAWTFPANTALNIPFRCSLVYSQATAAVSDSIGIQAVTVAPTNGMFTGSAETALGTTAYGDLVAFASTTATAVVTFTPSATATTFNAYIDGMIEHPSNASTSAFQIQIKTTTSADALTVYRGSYCKVG